MLPVIAASVSVYISICKYGDSAFRNFPELNFYEVEKRYNEIKEDMLVVINKVNHQHSKNHSPL